MTGDVRELLPLYALGILEAEEVGLVERAIAGDHELAAELVAYQETAHAMIAVSPPVAPPPAVKDRLLASVGGGRFEAFAGRMAKLFDVTLDRARELLALIERPASWVAQIPGISLVHFEGGPSMADADCGFIRMTPGALFPPHTHLGEELVTILAGQLRDMTNHHVLRPGDDSLQAQGTSHYLMCVGDEDCIYASRALSGIAIGGGRARPLPPT